MSDSVTEHKAAAIPSLNVAILTISDTRTMETDSSGALIESMIRERGHILLDRRIVRDEPEAIREILREWLAIPSIHAILLTGGTGLSPRDQTFETVNAMFTKPIPGYGELFRMLSYQQIGPAAILSRAVGGLIGGIALFTMPGSRAAVTLAMSEIILPELPHVIREARK